MYSEEAFGFLRDKRLAERVSREIEELAVDDRFYFTHICGTHEQSIAHYGLRTLLPEKVEVRAGPGCPVCICPARDIDEAIYLAERGVVVTTFGDMYRTPGSSISLADARVRGCDVRVVYGPHDATDFARKNPGLEVVFFAIGFETTAPTVAAEIIGRPPRNFSILSSHRLIPPAMELLLGMGDILIDGFICPGHVATIIGTRPFSPFPRAYRMPTVIAGFEPLDILMGIYMLLRQIRDNLPRLENEYGRSVKEDGNVKAQRLMEEVFEVKSGHWRGIGRLPSSALELREEFAEYDARRKYDIRLGEVRELHPGCECHLIITGKIYPPECRLFKRVCTPSTPKGPCMVSREGTCNIWYKYGALQKYPK